jgi:hypothetical protein
VGSWQGQGRSPHFTKVRISVQLLAVEGVCTVCVGMCTRFAGDDHSNGNTKSMKGYNTIDFFVQTVTFRYPHVA